MLLARLSSCMLLLVLITPNAHAEWRRYVGIHHSGFETFIFCECGSQTSKCWWLEPIEDAETELSNFRRSIRNDLQEAPQPDHDLSELPDDARYVRDTLAFFMEVEGFLSKPGEYGHLGAAERQLYVRKIFEIRQATQDDLQRCR